MTDAQEDLFGDNDETDHFFLPEHYDDQKRDITTPTTAVSKVNGFYDNFNDDDMRSLASSGLGDDDLPEEEEATNHIEDDDLDVDELVARARREANDGEDTGQDVHLPDLGSGVAGAGSMAAWMAGIHNGAPQNDEQTAEEYNDLRSREEILQEYYPSFKPHEILNFSELFNTRLSYLKIATKKTPKSCVPTRLALDVEPDGATEFTSLKRKRTNPKRGIVSTRSTQQVHEIDEEVQSDLDENDADLIMACAQWSTLR